MSISYIVPTIGRETLTRTLDSIHWRPGDEILVVGEQEPDVISGDQRCRFIECPRGNDWGHAERNFAMSFARGTHIAHIDDDDWYTPDASDLIRDAIEAHPSVPIIFKMRYPDGHTLWSATVLCLGNVGTPMCIVPNVPDGLGRFGSRHGGDYDFFAGCHGMGAIVWRPEVIVELGH